MLLGEDEARILQWVESTCLRDTGGSCASVAKMHIRAFALEKSNLDSSG